MALYPIGVVEEKTGLTARQIRYYEKKGLVAAERTPGNQRLFSDEDLARLKAIRELLEAGYPLSRITAVLVRELRPDEADSPDLSQYPAADRVIRRRLASLYPLRHREQLLQYLDRQDED